MPWVVGWFAHSFDWSHAGKVVPPGKEPALIRLVPHQRLDLRFAVSFSSGMNWVVAATEGDAVSFDGSSGLYGPGAGPGVPKGAEVQSLIFLAKKPGDAMIELHLERPRSMVSRVSQVLEAVHRIPPTEVSTIRRTQRINVARERPCIPPDGIGAKESHPSGGKQSAIAPH